MKKNILFSTTRQWNPGDEFILFGIINLIKEIVTDFNPIIYNRNPEVRQTRQYLNIFRKSKYCSKPFKGRGYLESFFRIGFWDNSFKDEMNLEFIDLVVFAGTPEWKGPRLLPLYKKLLNFNNPIIYLGLGGTKKYKHEELKSPYIDVLKKATLITVRDTLAYNELKFLNPYYLPCPSLFSSLHEKKIGKVKKVGLIFSTYKSVLYNKLEEKAYRYILKLYNFLQQTYSHNFSFEIICHYINELPEAVKIFRNMKIHYSYDAKDYFNIYKEFDLVIGPRVHGIGISASMGIPGIIISHDERAATAKGFLAEIININESFEKVISKFEKIITDIKNKNSELIFFKNEKKKIYLNLLRNALFGHS